METYNRNEFEDQQDGYREDYRQEENENSQIENQYADNDQNDDISDAIENMQSEEIQADSDSQADASEEPIRKEKKKVSDKTRLNQALREKYQYLNELNEMKAQMQKIEAEKELALQSAMRLHDDGVLNRLEKARGMMAAAIESGDPQAQTDAYTELGLATAEVNSLNSWKAQQDFLNNQRANQHHQNQYVSPEIANKPIIDEWTSRNTWANPESDDYDPRLAQFLDSYCNAYDANLARAGAQMGMFSQEYFENVNEAVAQARQQMYGNRNQGRTNNNYQNGYQDRNQYAQRNYNGELNMSGPRGGGAPVRNSGSYGREPSGNRGYNLTPTEREHAKSFGIPEKDFYFFKQREIEKAKRKAIPAWL